MFNNISLSSDLELRNARLWAVWNDSIHRVVFSSTSKVDAVRFAQGYYGSMAGWHIVRFDVSPLYKPLQPIVTAQKQN